ncbi:hypothetical protein SAMN05444358_1164 [Ruegeria halocynthiae]|uniref:Uncharacterized protein n=1 Tax=Ruegeria halocynthiae TaxID=985054 RepID=A0A1H3FL33_9RHOB|nr:hypothetical protein SAMN05444358_1164 [Ruegeria halocynthiae]
MVALTTARPGTVPNPTPTTAPDPSGSSQYNSTVANAEVAERNAKNASAVVLFMNNSLRSQSGQNISWVQSSQHACLNADQRNENTGIRTPLRCLKSLASHGWNLTGSGKNLRIGADIQLQRSQRDINAPGCDLAGPKETFMDRGTRPGSSPGLSKSLFSSCGGARYAQLQT